MPFILYLFSALLPDSAAGLPYFRFAFRTLSCPTSSHRLLYCTIRQSSCTVSAYCVLCIALLTQRVLRIALLTQRVLRLRCHCDVPYLRACCSTFLIPHRIHCVVGSGTQMIQMDRAVALCIGDQLVASPAQPSFDYCVVDHCEPVASCMVRTAEGAGGLWVAPGSTDIIMHDELIVHERNVPDRYQRVGSAFKPWST